MAEGDTWLNALVGAAVSIVLSFVPVSPALGGGVAAYLQSGSREEGARVGALSGGIAALPFALLLAVFGTFVLGFGIFPRTGTSVLGVGLLFLLALAVTVVYSALLGAVGGYLAVYLVEEDVL